ncbi:MAG: hypothetical protein QGH50_13885 [SAR324 cluster bacterium]|nr:hypothetical protein [SAR324 cluster bacterium]
MVLHLNHALKAYPLAGVPCIYGWGLCTPGGLSSNIQLLHLDQSRIPMYRRAAPVGSLCATASLATLTWVLLDWQD